MHDQAAKRIVGIAGRNVCGKGTAVEYFLKEHDGESFRYSTKLTQILKIYRIPNDRQNLQDLSTMLRGRWGEDLMARNMLQDCEESPKRYVVIEGIRRPSDVELIVERYGAMYTLVWMEADAAVRYERMRKRTEKAGESAMSWEEFQRREEAEPERQLDVIKAAAHYHVDNNGTLAATLEQLEAIALAIDPVAYG